MSLVVDCTISTRIITMGIRVTKQSSGKFCLSRLEWLEARLQVWGRHKVVDRY